MGRTAFALAAGAAALGMGTAAFAALQQAPAQGKGEAAPPAAAAPAAPAPAASALPQTVSLSAAAPIADVKLVSASSSAVRDIRIRNELGRPVKVRIEAPTVLVGPLGTASERLEIFRLAAGKWEAATAAEPVSLDPGDDLRLRVNARVPAAGDYEGLLDIAVAATPKNGNAPEAPASRRTFRLILSVPKLDSLTLPAGLVTAPAVVRTTWGAKDQHLSVDLNNDGETSLTVNSLCITSVTLGGAASAGAAAPKCGEVPVSIPSGHPASLTVPLPSLTPGEYRAKIRVGVDQAKAVEREVTLKVKAHWSLALLVFLLGAGLGWIVQQWRTRGRPAYAALEEITSLRQRAAKLHAPDLPELEPAVDSAVETLADAERKLRTGGDVASETIAVRARLGLIGQAQAVWRHFKAQPYNRPELFTSRLGEIADRLTLGDTDDAGAILKRVRGDLDQWREHHRLRDEADILLGQLADGSAAKRKLQSAASLADAPLSGPGEETLAARNAALRAAIEEAETALSQTRQAELDAVPPPAPAIPDPAPIDLPFIWLPPSGSSLEAIGRTRARWEVVTNLFALAVIAVTGLAATWLTSETWGSAGDIIGGFLLAAGAKYLLPPNPGGAGTAVNGSPGG